MKRYLFCEKCTCRKRHMILFISQQIKYEEERLKGESVIYSKRCLACNKISFVEVSLLEWKHLKQED